MLKVPKNAIRVRGNVEIQIENGNMAEYIYASNCKDEMVATEIDLFSGSSIREKS